MRDHGLRKLLAELERCDASQRIDLRDPILAHGTEAVSSLTKLVERLPDLGPSVVAWLEVLAKRDVVARPPSITALRGYAAAGSSNEVRRNAEQALHRLGVAGSPVKVGTSATIPAAAGTEWAGFRPGEFGRNPGTRWRSAHGRESLAPILTRDLRHRNEYFMSFGVERTPEIHFALAPRYKGDETSGFTASKLVVYAHGPTEQAPGIEPQVVAGWYIERGDGKAPHGPPNDASRWDWPLFVAGLRRSDIRSELVRVMQRHGLVMGDYGGAGRFTQVLGWMATIEGDEPVARSAGQTIAVGWDEILDRLESVAPTEWIDLHIWRTWPADEAIGAGQPFALRELAPVLGDLADVYLDVIGSRGR